jgi:hypothetical protein
LIPYTRINIKNALQGEYEENNERKPFTITEDQQSPDQALEKDHELDDRPMLVVIYVPNV